MTSIHIAPLLFKRIVIKEIGQYKTRCGEIVQITTVTSKHNFGCIGTYANGIVDGWHRSGRLYVNIESDNDIISKVDNSL